MDGDDEPPMAYFLPNGIADDSPPKKSRVKSSFGRIGGRSAAVSTKQSTDTSLGNATPVSAASGTSNSRSDVDFSGLHTRPRPTLDLSPFGSNGGPTSPPRATNFLLSDLGGEIHTPRDFGGSGGSTPTASRPFGFPGAFGPVLGEGGAIGGAGAIRSPTSMFDRGQEVAKSFSMQGESRSITTSGAYAADNPQLYRGAANLASYLSPVEADNPFGNNSMRTWPSDVSQSRRVLQHPPGLAGPPGLSEPQPMDGMQSRMRIGSGGDMMQQRVAGPQFGPFPPSTSSPMVSNGAFSNGDDQYGPSLLSSLRLSTGVFGDSSLSDQTDGRGVSNPDLAELNTHSLKIGDMDDMRVRQAVDSSSMHWDNREPTTSRRIDIQAKSKTPRSPKKARDGRRKSEGRSDLRAKALEFSMDAINAFTPGSPTRSRRTDRGRKMLSPISAQESSYDSNRDPSAPRGKRRNLAADKGADSATTGGNDNRRRGTTSQNDEPPALDSGENPVKLTTRESNKSRRREDTKPLNRSTSRRNSARGNDKGASTTRRQVYREKQVKDNAKEASVPEETIPAAASPSTPSKTSQESQVSSDGQKSEVEPNESKQDFTPAAESNLSATKAKNAPKAATSTKTDSDCVAEAHTTATQADNKRGAGADGNADDPDTSVADETAVGANTSHEATQDDPATSTERESSSSSDLPEDAQSLVDEPSEPHLDSRSDVFDLEEVLSPVESSESDAGRASASHQLTVSSKKTKRKSAAPGPATADISPPASHAEPGPSEPLQAPIVEKKQGAKEHRKEKSKKDKGDKKKMARSKKDKRGSSVLSKAADALNEPATETQDKMLEALAAHSVPLSTRISQWLRKGGSAAASAGLAAFLGARRGCILAAGRLNIKGILVTTFSYVESVLAVVFSVVLLLSLHAASWFIRIHRVAFRAILTHRHIGFCFAFLYGFPFLVQYVFPWAPPWAPVCLWYAFLVQLFCTNGPTAMVTTFRVILPLVFLVEGISHHSFLLDLNGAELLLTSFIISALKTSNLCSPIFFLSLATQCLLAVFLGSELVVQWLQLALALYSLHVTATTDDEWLGIGDEEEELSCHPVSMHPSIADYNHHPAPSSAVSIQKTKRLDRRALAYVRGRKLR